ncbi:ApeA N-terminal domain 1-containing protein [Micromonospora sp. PTRAS2]
MREIDELGLFWLTGHEEDTLTGRLRFDPEKGASVSLVGIFDNEADSDAEQMTRINGWIGSRRVTLDRCFLRRSNRGSTGLQESEYFVNQIFLGHHLIEDDLWFQTATAEWSDLDAWAAHKGVTEHPVIGGPGAKFQFTYDPPEDQEARFSRGRITLSTAWSRKVEQVKGVTFRHWPVFRMAYDGPQSFNKIRKDVGRIQSLLSLCMDTHATQDRLSLQRPDVRARLLSGEDAGHEEEIELLVPWLRYTKPADRKARHPHQMVLTLQKLGGIESVARWLDVSERFQDALDFLMSVQRAEKMFAENRFLNVTFASEAFHRTMYGGTQMDQEEFDSLYRAIVASVPEQHHPWVRDKFHYANEMTLRKRMRQLAAKAGIAAKPITGNIDHWAFAISQLRNDLTHLGPAPHRIQGGDLRALSDSVYAVTRACMLIECGVRKEELAEWATSYSASWLADRVKTAVLRVREHR